MKDWDGCRYIIVKPNKFGKDFVLRTKDGDEVKCDLAKGRYFICRVDSMDRCHRIASEAAVLMYAEMISDLRPKLSNDIREAIYENRKTGKWFMWDGYIKGRLRIS